MHHRLACARIRVGRVSARRAARVHRVLPRARWRARQRTDRAARAGRRGRSRGAHARSPSSRARVRYHRVAVRRRLAARHRADVPARAERARQPCASSSNGWGGKYRYSGRRRARRALQAQLDVPAFAFERVLEGGAVEFDGEGTCLTTESCLLNENRGRLARAARARSSACCARRFAVTRVLWLREGLAGDHTDGHIDNIARFVAPGVVMHMRARRRRSEPRRARRRSSATLRAMTDAARPQAHARAGAVAGRVLDARASRSPRAT